jgi:hypothetical protein
MKSGGWRMKDCGGLVQLLRGWRRAGLRRAGRCVARIVSHSVLQLRQGLRFRVGRQRQRGPASNLAEPSMASFYGSHERSFTGVFPASRMHDAEKNWRTASYIKYCPEGTCVEIVAMQLCILCMATRMARKAKGASTRPQQSRGAAVQSPREYNHLYTSQVSARGSGYWQNFWDLWTRWWCVDPAPGTASGGKAVRQPVDQCIAQKRRRLGWLAMSAARRAMSSASGGEGSWWPAAVG